MAILDSKKLLPSSKEGMLAKIPSRPSFTPKYSLVPIGDLKPETDSKPSEKKVTLLNQVIEVKKKTISIEKIVNKNTKIYQKSEENKRKLLERQKREKREEGLEAKKTGDKKEEKGLSVPGLGFLDRVKKFLLFTALGGLLGIVKEYIPKILDALKIAGPIFDFIEKTAIFLADGFATFIQKSYELNDAIRTEIESFGGDEALKKFDSFTDAFKKYANLAIMLFAAGVPGSIPLKGGKPGGKLPGGKLPGGKGGGQWNATTRYGKYLQRKDGREVAKIYEDARKQGKKAQEAKKLVTEQKNKIKKGAEITKKYGKDARRLFDKTLSDGGSLKRATANVEKAIKSGKLAAKPLPGSLAGTGTKQGGVFRRGPSRTLTRIQTKLIGRKNQLGLSRAARSFGNKANFVGNRLTLGGRVPVIGPLLMGYDTYMQDADGDGEPDKNINKALFVAGGSALGGLAGSFIPIPVLGSMLGTLFGGYVGDLMYEMILGKGPAAAGEKLKKDVTNALKASLDFGKHILDSVGRFFSYLPKKEILGFKTPIPDMVKIFSGGFDLVGAFKAALFPNTFTFAAGKVTKKDGDTGGGGGGGGGGSSANAIVGNDLFSTISGGEGGIDSYNTGRAGIQEGYTPPKPISQMTVGEIMDAQATSPLSAVGKYQIIPDTMKEFVQNMGISRDDVFNEETQDKFKKYVINIKRPDVGKYLTGAAGSSLEKAQLELAAEFASVGVPYDMKAGSYGPGVPAVDIKKGESLYKDYKGAGNRASISPETIAKALRKEIEINLRSGGVVIMGDSIAVGVRDAQKVSADTSMAKKGAGTMEILGNIKREANAGNLKGKTLQLSSGITNTKGDTDTVREQLRAAKAGGVTGVQLIGTANEGDYNQNAALQKIAQENEFKDFVKFQGGFKASGDAMHPESYSKLAGSLSQPTPEPTPRPTPTSEPKAQAGLTHQRSENIIQALGLIQAKNAIKKIKSIGTNKGTGDRIRIPDVGTFVSGTGFYQNKFGFNAGRSNIDKYFDQSGNRITNEEFDEILKSRYGITLSKPKLEPQLSPTPPKPTPEYSEGGKTKGGAHQITVGEKGPEFVLDADTTAGLEDNYPGFLDRINKADYKGSLDVLRNYAPYDKKSSTIFVQRVIIKETIPVSSNSSPYF